MLVIHLEEQQSLINVFSDVLADAPTANPSPIPFLCTIHFVFSLPKRNGGRAQEEGLQMDGDSD